MIKSTLKLIVAMSVLALGMATVTANAQGGGGGNGGGGGRGGAGGRGGGGGFGAPAPLPTIDALKTALTLTDDQVKAITPILAEITKSQADLVAAQTANTTLRAADIAKISALLTDTQKPLLDAQLPARGMGGRGGAGGGGAGGGGGRRGAGGGGGGGGATPPPAPPAPSA